MNGDGQPIIIPLAQIKPTNGVLTDAFTCPAGNHCLIQKIVFTNMAVNNPEKVSLALAQKGVAPNDTQFFYLQDFKINGNDYLVLEPQVTIDAGDVIRVKTDGDVVCAILGHLT